MSELKFPLFVDLTDKPVTVFGGGKIALRRIQTLLQFDARVKVVSPEAGDGLQELLAQQPSGLTWEQRCYLPGELNGEFLVLAATNDSDVNHAIVLEAKRKNIYGNNASDQHDNAFFFPAVAFADGISVGICGTGKDHHAVAKTAKIIRKHLSEGESL